MKREISDRRIGQDDLDECWCCGGLHDGLGLLCPDCDDAGCQYFDGECKSDHKPVLPDGGQRTTHCPNCDRETIGGALCTVCQTREGDDE
jgi:hypothetical protein